MGPDRTTQPGPGRDFVRGIFYKKRTGSAIAAVSRADFPMARIVLVTLPTSGEPTMNQLESRNSQTSAAAPHPNGQEPEFRTLRRAWEDGTIASLREAQGQGGPVEAAADASMPDSLKAKGRWRAQVDDAAAAWTLLTENDLQALEDHERTLSELIQARYGITRWEADRQVMAFIEDHLSSAL